MSLNRFWQACAALTLTAVPALAQQDPAEEHPPLLEGTLGGVGDLAEDNAPHSARLRFESVLGPWEKFKGDIRAKTGITFGGSIGLLYQNFSDPGFGNRDTAGQKFTLNISKDIINAGQADALAFDLVIEDRGPVGTEWAPLQNGLRAGSIVPTAATWGDFDLGITQAYVRQNLFNNSVQYTIGRIFAPNFIDAYPFFDDNRQFLNQYFSTSPTIPAPLRGFGAVAAWYPTDGGLYLQGGIYTANSQDTGWTVDNFFNDGEFFTSAEVGWSALANSGVPINARGPMDNNNVHLTFWHKDAQPDASPQLQPEAHGVAFNANFMYGPNIMWFLRAGWSDGWVSDRALSSGFGYRPSAHPSDLFGFAAGWSQTAVGGLGDQGAVETFYRYQVTPNFAVTPDFQVVFNPAANPSVDQLTVFGLRARLTF